jgi:hypothetical protein
MGVGFLFIGRVDIVMVAAFGLLVMIIILGMGLFIVYPDAQHTVYVLTDQRVLIFGTGRSKFLQEMQAHDIGPIQITERKDGTGDLFFASEVYRRSQRRGKASHFGFIAIPDVRTVEQHLREVFPNDGMPG